MWSNLDSLDNLERNLDERYESDMKGWSEFQIHGENGGTLGMVPLIINPIYTLYSGYLLGFMGYILKGSLEG